MIDETQRVDIRRWMGYPTQNQAETDMVFSTPSANSLYSLTLTSKLDALTETEELALVTRYLTPLADLEAGLLGSADNMDTQAAGPWIANPRELAERTRLYNRWRRDMCAFLGFPPGPALGAGGISLVRC